MTFAVDWELKANVYISIKKKVKDDIRKNFFEQHPQGSEREKGMVVVERDRDRNLMFYTQTIAKGHIREKLNVLTASKIMIQHF